MAKINKHKKVEQQKYETKIDVLNCPTIQELLKKNKKVLQMLYNS